MQNPGLHNLIMAVESVTVTLDTNTGAKGRYHPCSHLVTFLC